MSTVLITGIGRGIGYQLAKDFIAQGHRVIGTVRSQEAQAKIEQDFGDALQCYSLEVTDPASVAALATQLNDQAIDILINNAGIIGNDRQTIKNLDFDAWEETIKVNTLAPMRIALALLPNVRKSANGKIVTISSIMGSLARKRADSIAYRSSKSAVNKAMQCMAEELKPEDIGVYLMHPGWVKTDMGGSEADITAEESSKGLVKTILGFDMNDSGRFWQYDGEELEW